jgi:hypothetical protein
MLTGPQQDKFWPAGTAAGCLPMDCVFKNESIYAYLALLAAITFLVKNEGGLCDDTNIVINWKNKHIC